MEELNSRIKNIRESKNLSQEFVGNELGIGQSGYSKIENAKRELTVKELVKLAEIFQIGISELISEEKPARNVLKEPEGLYEKASYDMSVTISISDVNKRREILEIMGLK
ncbi:MAG TPA: helix-turn-helix transcriptional regulator [Pelobium sp.]|nr:helix-turn-helix transcriptional regulator [Pelobium sp.]